MESSSGGLNLLSGNLLQNYNNYFTFHTTRFDNQTSMWIARSARDTRFVAMSEAPYVTMLVGTFPWLVVNDSTLCPSVQTHTRYLKLQKYSILLSRTVDKVCYTIWVSWCCSDTYHVSYEPMCNINR